MLSHAAADGAGGHDPVRCDDGDEVGDADDGAPGHDGDGTDTNSPADDDAAAGTYHF